MAKHRRKSSKPSYVVARGVSKASTAEGYRNTGTFGAFRRPAVVGVSDDVAYATKVNHRAARRAERQWLKSLPKGVRV
jgi:hypothetical protein